MGDARGGWQAERGHLGPRCHPSPGPLRVIGHGRISAGERIVLAVSILDLLDDMPEAVTRSPSRLWSVLARSLGEQGANGRTALAWRWTLTGACQSPVTLTTPTGTPPGRSEILDEAEAPAELAQPGTDLGGQVMHARFVLEWLAGKIDALPLWNGGPKDLHVSDGAAYPHTQAVIEEAYFWALMAQERYPWRDESAPPAERLAFGWACGAVDLLSWACGEADEGPLSGNRVSGRPALYEVSLDACRGMTGVQLAREAGDPMRAKRREAVMETFLWLAGWNLLPPVDRHGHGTFEDCPERDAPCGCSNAGRCLRGECAACWRAACIPAATSSRASPP